VTLEANWITGQLIEVAGDASLIGVFLVQETAAQAITESR